MPPRHRNRQSPVDKTVWVTVETEDGNAVAGVDGVFDFDSEAEATDAAQRLAVEVGKPLSVVVYSREAVATYAAVTRVEKI